MLPTTPLHALLAHDAACPLVCTSGNLDGNPLEYEAASAEQNLASVADLWLHHDRPIAHPIDDSVVRVIAGRPVTIRLARGLAPLPLNLPHYTARHLHLERYLKTAVALCNGSQSVLAPHIGDHETLATRERYLEHCSDLQRLYRFQPEHLVRMTCIRSTSPQRGRVSNQVHLSQCNTITRTSSLECSSTVGLTARC